MRAWLLALLALVACVPVKDSRTPTAWERERPSVVIILGHLGGPGVCSGVVVRDNGGRAVVATAAHCVSRHVDPLDDDSPRIAELGQPVWFFVGHEWFAHRGALMAYDPIRDRCTVEASDLPPPLPTRKLSSAGPFETVHAISALFERTARGEVTSETFADAGSFFWDSTMDIMPGWSGSPVMDSHGAVVGLVVKCRATVIGPIHVCDRGSAIFTDAL